MTCHWDGSKWVPIMNPVPIPQANINTAVMNVTRTKLRKVEAAGGVALLSELPEVLFVKGKCEKSWNVNNSGVGGPNGLINTTVVLLWKGFCSDANSLLADRYFENMFYKIHEFDPNDVKKCADDYQIW